MFELIELIVKMNCIVFLTLLAISASSQAQNESCNLESLYKDSWRQAVVRVRLSDLFEAKFPGLLEQTRPRKRYLIPPAERFKKDIKKLFIEYGKDLDTVHDLEIVLKGLNYLQVPLFKAYKEDIEKFGTDLVID